MRELPFFFQSGTHRLFAMLHQPQGTTSSAFVFCQPFIEEKLWAHRVYVAFARRLASAGHAVLRFDYMGNGDSDGDFSESSLTTAIDDVRSAVDEVRRRTGATDIGLLGLRMGGTIAGLVAEQVEIDRLVLWAPVVDGARYMQEVLRINVTTQLATFKEVRQDRAALVAALEEGRTVNVDGYEMALPLFREVSAVKLAALTKCHRGRCLIVRIDRQRENPSAELQQLATSYPRGSLAFAEEDPFWKEIPRSYQRPAAALFETTLDWLGRA